MIRPRWDSPVIRRAIDSGINKTHLKTAIINRIKVFAISNYLPLYVEKITSQVFNLTLNEKIALSVYSMDSLQGWGHY